MPPQFEAYKFTPAQQAAAATAAAAQEKVAAAAEAAPAEEKAKVGKYWISHCGGPSLELMVMLEDMTLVDVQYLIAVTEAGGVVPRYQELPAAARIGPHNAWRLRCWNEDFELPVLVLS